MNLVVVRPDGSIYARPDTTLVRGARDFYLPDDFSWVEVRPCRWIRILKSAKAVQERFAQRYYDAVGSGLLLYGDGTDALLDASSYIFDDVVPAGQPDSNGLMPDLIRHLNAALSAVTAHLLLHQGDLLILESPDSTTLHRGDAYSSASFRIL